jgi:hypothetical protein
MKRTFATGLGLSLLIVITSPAGAEIHSLVESAFARGSGSSSEWAYTRTKVENGSTIVERFDPAGDDGGWTLVEVDGKAPSNKQLKKYAAKIDQRESRDHPGEIDFRDIVNVDTVTLVEETATDATYRFEPAPDEEDDADPSAFLEGTLAVDKRESFVKSLELASIEPFSPATGVKINKMRVTMKFTLLDDGARTAIRELSQSVEGRLFGIKRISQASTVTFSDFGPQN